MVILNTVYSVDITAVEVVKIISLLGIEYCVQCLYCGSFNSTT